MRGYLNRKLSIPEGGPTTTNLFSKEVEHLRLESELYHIIFVFGSRSDIHDCLNNFSNPLDLGSTDFMIIVSE